MLGAWTRQTRSLLWWDAHSSGRGQYTRTHTNKVTSASENSQSLGSAASTSPPSGLHWRTDLPGTWGQSLPHSNLGSPVRNTRDGATYSLRPGPHLLAQPRGWAGYSLGAAAPSAWTPSSPLGRCCPQIPRRWVNSWEALSAGPGLLTAALSEPPVNLQQLLKDLSPASCRLKRPIVAKASPQQHGAPPGAG